MPTDQPLTPPAVLFLASVAYLALLFAIAEAAERGWIPSFLAHHPMTFAFSLGIYATSWTLFGSVGLATREGYGFLTIYLGVTLACLAIPILWLPLLRVVRSLQLSSLADVFAYRFQSQSTGAVVTLFMLVSSLPYLALQIRSVSGTAQVLIPGANGPLIALCAGSVMSLFAVMFGARHTGTTKAHPGLVLSMAVESLFKLFALLLVGLYVLWDVFDGPSGFDTWIAEHPESVRKLVERTEGGSWETMLLLAFCASFLLPRQFFMAFAKHPREKSLLESMWALPLILFLMNIPIPLVLFAAQERGLTGSPDLYILRLAASSPAVSTVVFLGGFAAASGMVIVCSIALAGMVMNHLVLPVWRPATDFYRSVTLIRRILVVVVVFGGYGLSHYLTHGVLAELGLLTFAAVLQFLPGLIGVVYWPNGSRAGFIGGLSVGIAMWMGILVLPQAGWSAFAKIVGQTVAVVGIDPTDEWSVVTWPSLFLNGLTFVALSLLWPPRPEESDAAAQCVRTTAQPGVRGNRTHRQLIGVLETALGREAAAREVDNAAMELAIEPNEHRPWKLRQLEDRVEANLSGLIGPMVARHLLGRRGPPSSSDIADQLHFVEENGVSGPTPSGTEAVNAVRRYLSGVLEGIPLGICTTGTRQEVLLWNQSLTQLTTIERGEAIGAPVSMLPAPWSRVFGRAPEDAPFEVVVDQKGRNRILNVGCAAVDRYGRVFVVEDLTERKLLEATTAHHDRLQSIGRLAAGVAHEIGNPLAGILMVARNLRAEDEPEDLPERLDLIVSEATRIQSIVASLVSFSRRDGADLNGSPIPLEPTRLKPIVESATRLVKLTHRDKICRADCDENIQVVGEPQQLTQMLVNLLSNACDASPPGSDVFLEVKGESARAIIEVIDHGRGIEPEVEPHIFEPFFTTKDSGSGTGLGLAIVHRIVHHHGGSITVESTVGVGTRFLVALRRAEKRP